MTAPAVPIPSVDALHAHFAEWVWYLDAKGVEFTTQQAKLEAKKVKTRTAVPAKPPPSESSETTRGNDFLDRVFRAQTRSELENDAYKDQGKRAPESISITQDNLEQDTDGLASPAEATHGSGSTVTSPKIPTVEDDELS